MHIQSLSLYTQSLEAEKAFYRDTLGFAIDEKEDSFSVQIGTSILQFVKSEDAHLYHYCFLIPRNQLQDAVAWLGERLPVLEIEPGRFTQRFESWNADSVYFYDGSGNIAECIVRHDLKNDAETEFGVSSFLCVNEIGLASDDVASMNQQLGDAMGTSFWKGDLERFGTHGSQHGLFLLPNYHTKTTWFPTQAKVEPAPFEAIIQYNNVRNEVRYRGEKLSIQSII